MNTTALVLHADPTFAIVPNELAESMRRTSRNGAYRGIAGCLCMEARRPADELSSPSLPTGTCPRPFRESMQWLQKMFDALPQLYDADEFKVCSYLAPPPRRWENLIALDYACRRLRLKGDKSSRVYTEVTQNQTAALAGGPDWKRAPQSGWISLPTMEEDGETRTALFQLRCHKMDLSCFTYPTSKQTSKTTESSKQPQEQEANVLAASRASKTKTTS
eukprot:scaffold7055_cov254-Pinguiococcus_pyrenoidosus.AAC.3